MTMIKELASQMTKNQIFDLPSIGFYERPIYDAKIYVFRHKLQGPES